MHKTWRWSVTGAVLTYTHEEIRALCQHAGLAGIEGGRSISPYRTASAYRALPPVTACR